MTGSAPEAAVGPNPASGAPQSNPSVAARRASRLLTGGLIGAHGTAVACAGFFAVSDGITGLLSAAFGAALVIGFYTVGQAVQVRVADAPATRVFRASIVSYIARVTALGGVLALYLHLAGGAGPLHSAALAITAVATVVGWLTGEVLTFSRLRIPNFDAPGEGGLAK